MTVLSPFDEVIRDFAQAKYLPRIKKLLVYPDNMQRNMNVYGGVVFSQRVLLALVDKGLTREAAYEVVQSLAHQAWNQDGGDFRALVSSSDRVQAHLTAEEIAACFDPNHHLRNLDEVYQRLGI